MLASLEAEEGGGRFLLLVHYLWHISIICVVVSVMDLPSIRWQLLRTAEASQIIERENVSLRQEVADLRKELEERSANTTQIMGFDPRLAKNIMNTIQKHQLRTKGDVIKLKQLYSQEQAELLKQLANVQQLQTKLAHYITNQQHEITTGNRERKRLLQQIEALEQDIAAARNDAGSELRNKDEIISQLKEEIRNDKASIKNMEEIISKSESRCKSLEEDKQSLEHSLQVYITYYASLYVELITQLL